MYTKEQVETALDAGKLKCCMHNGNLWQVRRNGKTRYWKKDPERFEIPIKIGFRMYGKITKQSLSSDELVIGE